MQPIIISGLGRSGTSWIYKVFDQHPDVFASYEPEAMIGRDLKERLRDKADTSAVDDFISEMLSSRGLRTASRRPIVRKSYRSELGHLARVCYIYGLAGLVRMFPSGKVGSNWRIPDFAQLRDVKFVAKLVSQQLDLSRIIESRPDIRAIYVVRHPCGQIISHLKGLKVGKMKKSYLPPRHAFGELFSFHKSVHDLVEEDFTQLEINAYRWAVFCHANYLASKERPNILVVRYEDICIDPIGEFKRIFDWAEVTWHQNCKDFVAASLSKEADANEYHGLVRNPLAAANRWRKTISAEDKNAIINICKRSSAARLYDDIY